MASNYAIVGGAGFIGSHFANILVENGKSVKVIDNLCSGTLSHLKAIENNPLLEIFKLDVENTIELTKILQGSETVIHLASNPDIARAASEPRIDFVQGTVLTESVVEASRLADVNFILYASGSGVYGDAGSTNLSEKSPTNPISTYGASKLAGEALLASYAYMFDIRAAVFRFANVVGPRQTHGVGYDFIRRLTASPHELKILGDGSQDKSYVHVSDVVNAVLMVEQSQKENFDVFNISTKNSLTVNEIAKMSAEVLGLELSQISLNYTGGDRGWKADVPIVKLDPTKIENLGWKPFYTSRSAMADALKSMLDEF